MDMRGHNSRMNPGNWIAVSRDMRDHPIVGMGQPVKPANPKNGSFSRYEAWQDLLMLAQYKPGAVDNKGKIVMLDRGQLMGARNWLAERWNWTEKTVRVFISKLEGEFMVRSECGQREGQKKGQRSGHYSNIITICNYDIYQTVVELMAMEKGQSEDQSQGQSRASQGPELNKGNNKREREGARDDGEGSRLPEDWQLPKEWGQWATHYCKRDREWVLAVAEKFKDYWLSVPDSKGFKKNWKTTWQNWCRNTLSREARFQASRPPNGHRQKPSDSGWLDRMVAEAKANGEWQ